MAEQGDETLIKCNQCGNDVPRMKFCVRCGHTLDDEYRGEQLRRTGHFAAHPDEPLRAVALISTFFPQLPRADMHVFRFALAAGVVIVIALAALGAFPLAVSTAAVLVPTLMVLYLWDVDVYEDEPRIILGATMLWGAVTGALASVVIHRLPAPTSERGLDIAGIALGGVVIPLVTGALMLIGPLILLRWRRFNDVIDGATFGASSAVAFVGAKLLVDSTSMWSGGLRPGGDPMAWSIKLISLGVLEPLIAAGVIGAVAAAFWLRYRAPVTDRSGLGAAGHPIVAILAGAALLIVSGVARSALGPISTTIVELVVAALAIVWLRTVLHYGLLEESREVAIGPSIRCPNCGHETPHHTFCGNCGVALSALPRRPRQPAEPAPAEPSQP